LGDRINKASQLFLTFLKIGAFTFGGGYAMIPLIQREVAEKKKWITGEDILEIVAVAESTPGPIAINAATFVGYRTCGFTGACAATLGVVLPSFLIISLISLILNEFQSCKAVQYAFSGIRAAVLALILKALWMMYKSAKKKNVSYFIMGTSLILTAFLRIDAVFVIIGCGIFGLIWSLLNRKEQSNDAA
jgi:chromate transporter